MSRNLTTKEVRTLQEENRVITGESHEEHAVGRVAYFGTAKTEGKMGIIIKLKRYTAIGFQGFWSYMPQ